MHLDALTVREYTAQDGSQKKNWTKLGKAFQIKTGGYTVVLDAMPAPAEGQYKIILKEPKDFGDSPPPASKQQSNDDEDWNI